MINKRPKFREIASSNGIFIIKNRAFFQILLCTDKKPAKICSVISIIVTQLSYYYKSLKTERVVSFVSPYGTRSVLEYLSHTSFLNLSEFPISFKIHQKVNGTFRRPQQGDEVGGTDHAHFDTSLSIVFENILAMISKLDRVVSTCI